MVCTGKRRGFTLMEMLIVLGLLFLFGAASVTTLMVSNQAAMTNRNQTLARAIVVERINEIVASETVTAVNDEPVVLWQVDDGGDAVQIEGVLDVETLEDDGGVNTQRVRVTLTYNFAGREIIYSIDTIVVD